MSTTALDNTAGYLTLGEVTCRTVNGDSHVHRTGTVLSAWEVDDFVKGKIAEGSARYRSLFEPLTENEVQEHRSKATALEGDHVVNGQYVSAPWDDYVGLHPEEVLERLYKSSSREEVDRVKLYEAGGLKRARILDYTAPVEREPWQGYNDLNVREILEKLDVLSAKDVSEALSYESAHRKRPAIITYEPTPAPKGRGKTAAADTGGDE